MKCNHCGQEIADDSMFCELCGAKVTSVDNAKQIRSRFLLGIVAVVLIIGVVATIVIVSNHRNNQLEPALDEELQVMLEDTSSQIDVEEITVKEEARKAHDDRNHCIPPEETTVKEEAMKAQEVKQSEKPVRFADEMPEYVGGMDAMYSFLRNELQYPEEARVNGIQGTVLLEFVIERDGSVSNIKPLVSLFPECDAEAVRVVKKMPKWRPGKQDGKPVRCYFNLPIRFTLQ